MSRSYRMRYHNIDDVDDVPREPVDPTHKPTRIFVWTMPGKEHILFTERDGETFLDVKRALLPHLNFSPTPSLHRLSLSLWKEDRTLDVDVDDDRVVPFNDGDVKLEVNIKDLTMNAEQQALIDKLNFWRVREDVQITGKKIDTPDKIEALLFYIEDKPPRILQLGEGLNMIQIRTILMHVIHNNIPIQSLVISTMGSNIGTITDGLNADEMREVFDMIRQITTLRYISIRSDITDYEDANLTAREDRRRISYRMNDLAELLYQNTFLRRVDVAGCNIIFDEDGLLLSYVLISQDTLERLQIWQNKTTGTPEIVKAFGDSLEVAKGRLINNVNNRITCVWTRSGHTNFL